MSLAVSCGALALDRTGAKRRNDAIWTHDLGSDLAQMLMRIKTLMAAAARKWITRRAATPSDDRHLRTCARPT
jgi:hypothetical protein